MKTLQKWFKKVGQSLWEQPFFALLFVWLTVPALICAGSFFFELLAHWKVPFFSNLNICYDDGGLGGFVFLLICLSGQTFFLVFEWIGNAVDWLNGSRESFPWGGVVVFSILFWVCLSLDKLWKLFKTMTGKRLEGSTKSE